MTLHCTKVTLNNRLTKQTRIKYIVVANLTQIKKKKKKGP